MEEVGETEVLPDNVDKVVSNHIHESERNGSLEYSTDDKKPIKMPSEKQTSHTDKHHSSSKHSSSSDKHKSSSSDKHKSSSDHKSGSDKHRPSDDKHKHHSSSSSDKHKSSHSSDKHRSSSSSSKHSSSDKSSSKHSLENKHKSENTTEKPKSENSSDKHKCTNSSDKHKTSSSGDKHKSSSSSDKHRSSSSSDKHRSGSSSDKHKTSSSHKSDKHSSDKKSSSSSDKHKSSSSSEHKHKSSSNNDNTDKQRTVQENCSDVSNSKLHINTENDFDNETVKISPKKEIFDSSGDEADAKQRSDLKLSALATVSVRRETVEDIQEMIKKAKSEVKKEELSNAEISDAEMEDNLPSTSKRKIETDEDSEDEYKPKTKKTVTKKIKKENASSKRKSQVKNEDDDFSDDEPLNKKKKPQVKKEAKKVKEKMPSTSTASPQKGKAKKEEESLTDVWRWWEEEKTDISIKWKTLEHKGPVFAESYVPLPDHVKFYYDGKPMKLTTDTEEVMTFYGKMIDHDYTTKKMFNDNFFKDWRQIMTLEEKEKIKSLDKCNFSEINEYYKQRSEERKNRSKEEKQAEKAKNEALVKEYGTALIDGYRQKIGNFRIEPPSLFRGRGEHPKMGCLKKRIWPKDVMINCSKGSKIPDAPFGQQWKEVRHDNTVTWLASWTENVQGQTKYVMLNASSRLKGEKDWMKYEMARKLHKCVDEIRASYREDMQSKEMRIRQRAVAMYFIDKLALRAGNEKDEETADTVGCCTLRFEHIRLHDELGGKEYVVEFDFLGKDSMRYQNQVAVDKRAFKNLKHFMKDKAAGDDLFDRLNTSILNKHLTDLMEGLTAKVFRTYNASKTLQDQLDLLTVPDDPLPAKMLSYNRANRAVAVLCNHQRSVPKSFGKQMENLQVKIDAKRAQIKDAKKIVKAAKAEAKSSRSEKAKSVFEQKKKIMNRLEEQLTKLEVSATDKDENKDIALGTSKLNYLDPRISVAWCKKYEVPVDKVYNKTQREKFQWAIDMATADFHF